MSLPITSLVAKASWKELLVELVATEKLDPWNIDIVKVADSFFKTVREMQQFDFRVPANIILACAILLKYKSRVLAFHEEEEALPEAVPEEEDGGAVQQLELKGRIPPKRQITLNELVGEMERVMKYEKIERNAPKPQPMPVVDLEIGEYDIESEIERVFGRVKEKADSEGVLLFSTLLEGGRPEHVMEALTPLLHLAQRKDISLRQDRFFDEIFIRVCP